SSAGIVLLSLPLQKRQKQSQKKLQKELTEHPLAQRRGGGGEGMARLSTRLDGRDDYIPDPLSSAREGDYSGAPWRRDYSRRRLPLTTSRTLFL
ncbi:MAG: hypothetical protein ACRYE7_02035, partial [Janthinobacterium lividum]